MHIRLVFDGVDLGEPAKVINETYVIPTPLGTQRWTPNISMHKF
jgi:hypothetical protein